jgi:hypothetical protein
MSAEVYDAEAASITAWHAVKDLCRLLTEAIRRGQDFTVEVAAGDVENPPVQRPDGSLCAAKSHLDGSCEIRINIKPPPRCPKCGGEHAAALPSLFSPVAEALPQ